MVRPVARALFVGLIVPCILVACPEPTATTLPAASPSGSFATPPAVGSTPPTSPPAPTTRGATFELECPNGKRTTLDRSCTKDSDCGTVEEQVCCGGRAVTGVRAAEAAKVAALCGALDCGQMRCPGGFRTEDGESMQFSYQRVAVGCAQGVCKTHMGCCEDGLAWSGCCATSARPTAHRCGDTGPCRIACVGQTACN